jgi:hypothetical protein
MTLATLAGVPLLGLETVAWRFTQGVAPYQRTFEVTKDRADAILRNAPPGREVELFIGGQGRKPLLVQGLSVLSLAAARHPDRVSVLVADRRIWWDRKKIIRRFNVRRKSGERRLVDGNLERINALDDVTFARFSLRDEVKKWLAREAIEDVLKEVTESRYSIGKVDLSKEIDIDGLELADDGDAAVKRVLDYVPGLTVYLDERGIATLTLATSGEEEEQLEDAPPLYVGPSIPLEVDMSRMRPDKVEVYFQPEDELRFDFLEGLTPMTTSREPREIKNVMPLPDRKLSIAGMKSPVVQGTWVEINQALLDAWNNDPANPAEVTVAGKKKKIPPITFDQIQTLWLSPGGYHLYYEIQGGNSVWARRWNALMQHYRQTFQISRRWRDRIRSARAERAAIIDPENARRAPADVYADHCVLPSAKRIAAFFGDTSKKLGVNQKAWDDLNDNVRLLVSTDDKKCAHLASTAILVPVDQDQMVFHVKFQADQEGNTLSIVPSLLTSKADGGATEIPEADPRAPLAAFMLHLGRLSPKHRFTTVLTVAPASPQGLLSLYKMTITPEGAKRRLPSAIARKIGDSKGPTYQLFVTPNVATARSAWRDEDAKEIEDQILLGKRHSPARLLDPDHLTTVAECMAAEIYALLADRMDGTRVSSIAPDVMPVGRIAAVLHELGPGGALTTRADMPQKVKPIDWRSLLPEGTRRFLFGQVQV